MNTNFTTKGRYISPTNNMVYLIVFLSLFLYISTRTNIMITTLYAIHLEASNFQLGTIIALAALFPMTLAIYAGKISDLLGSRYPLIFGTFGVSIALLLPCLFAEKLFILYISQSMFGLANIFFIVSIQNLIGQLSTSETVTNNFAINSLSVSLASFVGPLLTGTTIDRLGFGHAYFLLSILAAIPCIIITFNIVKLPHILPLVKKDTQNSFLDLLSSNSLRKSYAISAVILIGVVIYDFYFPIYGKHLGFSASIIGIILSSNAAAYFIARLFMASLIKKFDERIVFIGCLFIASVSFTLIPFLKGFIALTIVSFLMGLGLGCCQPLSIVMVYNSSPKGRTGEVLGLRLMINNIVQFLVPIIFGSIGLIISFFPIFLANAFLFLTSGFSIMFERKKMMYKSLKTKGKA